MRQSKLKLVAVFICVATVVWCSIAANSRFFPLTNAPILAVVGDFGSGDLHELAVANLVHESKPQWFASLGDNAYTSSSYQSLVGDYFGDFVSANRFIPVIGNHDYSKGADEFDRYFSLDTGQRNFSVEISDGFVIFVLDSQNMLENETSLRGQREWLAQELKLYPDYKLKVVLLHHTVFSSGEKHGSNTQLQWDFRSMGVSAVFSGHEHLYERLEIDAETYLTVGTGGKNLYQCGKSLPGSIICQDRVFGVVFVYREPKTFRFVFEDTDGRIWDEFELKPVYPSAG